MKLTKKIRMPINFRNSKDSKRLAALLACVLSSCSYAYKNPSVTHHMINVDADGKYTPTQHDVRFNKKGGTDDPNVYQNHLTKIFDEIKHMPPNPVTGKKKILVFIHGGLNLYQSSIERVEDHYEAMFDEGTYAIFIHWRSFFFSTYKGHLTRIREGKVSRLAAVTAPVYLITDIARAIVMTPRTWVAQGIHSLNKLRERGFSIAEAILGVERTTEDTNPQEPFINYVEHSKKQANLPLRTWSLIMTPLKWVQMPFISDIGRPAWDIMRRRTRTLFRKPKEFDTHECADIGSNDPVQQGCVAGTGALADFGQALQQFLVTEAGATPQQNGSYELIYVGHSMGTFVINELLTARPDTHVDHIVYMAAAATIRDVTHHVIPYLSHHSATHFYSLFLHPDNDNSESHFLGLTPSGSLLAWIDNYYTTPITHLDRTSGRWENMRSALHVFPPQMLNSQIHFKIFGFNSQNSPQRHGDFDNFPYWEPHFWWKGSWQWRDKGYQQP